MADLTGVKELLIGPSGTGKTFAISTAVKWAAANNSEVFVLFTEHGLETLVGVWADKGEKLPDCLHWHNAHAKPISLAGLMTAADNVGKLSYESITKLVDGSRSLNNAFLQILTACSNFKDDRTGKEFGPVDSWKPDRIFVIDSLTELSNAAMKMVIGSKPTASQPDYGVAQNNLMNFLRLCTQGCNCHFILTGHVSRETDMVLGGTKLMVRAIGTAIAGDIPPLFSDVIYSYREGTAFYWDTSAANVDVKTRNLPIQAKLQPDFAQVLDKWKSRANLAVKQ